jgi:hypothetical protein
MLIGLVVAILMSIVVAAIYFMFFKKNVVPIDCVGTWSKNTACPVDCGLPASNVMETYKVTTPMKNGGIECLFTDGNTRSVDCPETNECPVDCVGAWVEAPCPASCEGTTVQERYNITVTGNATGNECPYEQDALRDKACPAVPSECNGPEYNSSIVYTGPSSDNYFNYCNQMKTEGNCSKENVRRNCRNECT